MAIYLYIDGSDRTGDLERDTLRIRNQIQQRADSISFTIFQNAQPSENEQVRFFRGDTIASFATKTVTLNGNFQKNVNFFYPGQVLKIRIGDSDEEEVVVDTYDEDNLQIVLVEAPSGTVSAGDKIGEIMFGGVVSRVSVRNVEVAQNVEYDIEGVDYNKLFDKKLVSDTWEDVDARYIINSFVNTVVNFNRTIDDMEYANNTAIQAAWSDSSDADNPTVDSADYIEGLASGVFPWTNSGGTALWEATPTSADYSDFSGVASGIPVSGEVMLWVKTSDQPDIDALKVRIGSDSSNYATLTLSLTSSTDWQYARAKLVNASITGTPDWQTIDYAAIEIDNNNDGQIRVNGLRVNLDGSFTLFNVESTPPFDNFRVQSQKPTALMQILAKTYEYTWYIDYNYDIHYKPLTVENAPFDVTDASDNFTKLRTKVDQSQLGNRITILGGEEVSDSVYAQVIDGDSARREWLMKAKFKNLALTVDDGSSTDTMEGGTTTTTVVATAHGLSVGDHVVMRDRGDVVREVLTVPDPNSFTVEDVPSQTSGDTFSKFSITKTVGIEGIVDETTVDYVSNSNEKSVRATASEDTYNPGTFIRFAYNERVPIQVQYIDVASANSLKALGIGDGIFDLDPIIDNNIDDRGTAIAIAEAKVREFSNAVIDGSYMTDWNGLKAGQLQRVQDTNRNFDDEYVIQTISIRQRGGEFADYFEYTVNFGTTLFGWIEFMQKLLSIQDRIDVNEDAIIATFVVGNEIVESSDVNQITKDGGTKNVKNTETVESSESNTVDKLTTGTWRFEPNGVGQPFETRFDLCDFG